MRTSATVLLAGISLCLSTPGAAIAEWRWVEEEPRTETYVYEERLEPEPRTETYVYEEREAPIYRRHEPGYYRERSYRTETYAPVVTHREVFRRGRCDITRTWLSDGSTSDERVCSRPLLPHEFLIDRIQRRVDRWRSY